jgi:sigma-B regulation protein RsbU (phosphoserine phosphatase)
MSVHHNFSHFNQRMADLANSFEGKAEEWARRHDSAQPGGTWSIIWRSLRDLFTRDVTRDEMRRLLQQETRDTYRFFTRNVDFESLRPLPRFKRYPLIAWFVFVEMAYRLSPPRRIAFAIAIFCFLFGLIGFLSFSVRSSEEGTFVLHYGSGGFYWFIAILLFGILLLMELRDKLDLKGDLTIAREIQFGLVPAEFFEKDAMAIHCRMRPANTVGGDYYDIISLREQTETALVMGDVAGKGMPAALLMALLQGSLRTLATAGFRGSTLMAKLNEYLCSCIPPQCLITLFYSQLNTTDGSMSYVNAGHNPPLLLRQNGSVEKLDSTSLVLGVLKETPYEARTGRIEPGDWLVLYTDGLTEAFNPREEEYGLERLTKFLVGWKGSPPSEFIPALIADVLKFCDTVRPTDDITVMLVTRKNQN